MLLFVQDFQQNFSFGDWAAVLISMMQTERFYRYRIFGMELA